MSRPHSYSRGQPQASTSALQPVPTTSQLPTPVLPAHAGLSGGLSVRGETLADTQAIALEMVQTIVGVMSNMTDTFPIPSLKIGLSALLEVIKKTQIMQTNVEGVAILQERLRSLIASIDDFRQRSLHRRLPPEMIVRIEGLVKVWEAVAKRAKKIRSHGTGVRFITSNRGAKELGDLIGEINESIQDKIMMQGILNIESYLYEIRMAIKASLDVTFMPRYAKMAPYDSNDVRQSCLEGTRVEFLQDIYTWITAACDRGAATPDGGIILWINGLAGTGKTTVARSVAEWCDKRGILGGSFFCSRSDWECSDPTQVFPTLCRQLCAHHQPFKDKVQPVLDQNPDIFSYGLYRQFEELIVLPLEALDSPFPRFVFVFDAVDELKDKVPASAKSTIILVIAKFVSRIAKFLLLVMTSRPEADIAALFEAKREDSLKNTTTPLFLRDIPLDVALKDIKLYIDCVFEDNIGVLGVEPGWPSAEEKNTLVEQSQGWFMYIVAAIEFIMDKTHRDPKGRMDLLINPMPKKSSTPHQFLFALYTTSLRIPYEKMSPGLARRLLDVLGTVVFAREALSPLSIAQLVGLDTASVRSTLIGLHSVLHIPTDDSEPIHIIHHTFPEFLLKSPEAASVEFRDMPSVPEYLCLQPAERHWYLFSRCIEVMSSNLRRDMIDIRHPAMFQSEIDNLKERVKAAVGPHVSYSCRFWGHHLREGIGGAATLDVWPSFRSFVRGELLYWIETCSLLGNVDGVVFILDTARNALQAQEQHADLVPLLTDCRRFILEHAPCIHAAPLQLYYSPLTNVPTACHVRAMYADQRDHAPVVDYGTPATWEPFPDTFPGAGGFSVDAVACSPDGTCFVTGGGDKRATIWRTASRTPVVSFGGHAAWVNCVAFAPDGQHVASGSNDRRIYVWQASSASPVYTLEGHRGIVASVAYSEDGRRIVSATDRGEVKLWDTAHGRCLLTLNRTGNSTFQIGISTDGNVIARGSGSFLRIHNVSSATNEALEFPDAVEACTFSPNGRYIAARSWYAIRVWDWANKTLVRSIDVLDNLSGRLAFLRNGSIIASGFENGFIRLWKVTSEEPPCILQGPTGCVNDLSCSPGQSRMVSVASDGMIGEWDEALYTTKNIALPLRSTSGPSRFALIQSGGRAVALLHLPPLGIDAESFPIGAQTPEGAPTVALFSDVVDAWTATLETAGHWYGHASAHAWSSLTGKQHIQLSWRRAFAISLDKSLMAYPSPSSDRIVNVYDLRIGTVVATLVGHTKDVRSIAFSPNNSYLASGSEDGSVKIWDTLTGALIFAHNERTSGCINDTAFSHDDRLVASGSTDKTVRIFEAATRRVIHALGGHRNSIMGVLFATDDIHVVALDSESWIYVLDCRTGARLREFCLQHHDHLRSPFLSPDGIFADSNSGFLRTVSLWDPVARMWPVYHITRDGWVYAMCPEKTQRLCCVPAGCISVIGSDGSTLCMCEGRSGSYERGLVVLNMVTLLEYVDGLVDAGGQV